MMGLCVLGLLMSPSYGSEKTSSKDSKKSKAHKKSSKAKPKMGEKEIKLSFTNILKFSVFRMGLVDLYKRPSYQVN
jgi:hypothetical protein